MDERETSAMTEASGLVTDPAGAAAPSGTRSSHPPRVNSGGFATDLAERLREITVKAPLQALFAAFLLGVWMARRR